VTGKEMMNNDILLTEKNTSMDPSALVQLDDGGTSSNVPSSSQNITLALDHELQHLSLESKLKNSKTNVKKTASVSHYKPEPWMLQSENQEIRNQLSLAIVSNNRIFLFSSVYMQIIDLFCSSLTETICQVGHVDSGKSTLCGRLRHALGLISKKQMHKYEKEAKEKVSYVIQIASTLHISTCTCMHL
jgi:elongation factor 1 alpha-like protein